MNALGELVSLRSLSEEALFSNLFVVSKNNARNINQMAALIPQECLGFGQNAYSWTSFWTNNASFSLSQPLLHTIFSQGGSPNVRPISKETMILREVKIA